MTTDLLAEQYVLGTTSVRHNPGLHIPSRYTETTIGIGSGMHVNILSALFAYVSLDQRGELTSSRSCVSESTAQML